MAFSIVHITKIISIFLSGYPHPPAQVPQGERVGYGMVLNLIPQKIMNYVNSGVYNIADFKNLPLLVMVSQTPSIAPMGGRGLGPSPQKMMLFWPTWVLLQLFALFRLLLRGFVARKHVCLYRDLCNATK